MSYAVNTGLTKVTGFLAEMVMPRGMKIGSLVTGNPQEIFVKLAYLREAHFFLLESIFKTRKLLE